MIYRDHRFHYRPTSPGSVLGNITLGFYIPPPHKHTHAHLISSKRGKPAKMFFIRWPPSIVPFLENTPNSFWRNSNEFHSGLRSHGTVYCGGEKTQIDQHWFSILCWWKSKANYYSLLAGGWVGPKIPNNLETWVKMTGSSCWPNCFVCLLWLPPEVLYGDCVACYAYLRIWIQTQFAEYKTHTKLGFSFVLWFNTAKFCVDFPKLSNIIAPYCLPCDNSLA